MSLVGANLFAWNLNVTGPIYPIYFGQFSQGSNLEGTTHATTSPTSGPYSGDLSYSYSGNYSVDEDFGVFHPGTGYSSEVNWAYSAAFDVPSKEIRIYMGTSCNLDSNAFETPMVDWDVVHMP